jgi:hypothetical protein
LSEDDYTEVRREDAQPGDVIIYMSTDGDGDIEHSGIVLELRPAIGFDVPVPIVCSKWGGGAEVVHPYNYCPYNPTSVRFYRVVR